MDNTVLKKRLNTFRSEKGSLARISDEVSVDVHRAWESWEGSTVQFAKEIGITSGQLVIIIKKGRKLIKSGVVTDSEFKQISVQPPAPSGGMGCKGGILVKWERGRLIRFSQVDQLVDFLKKVA